MKKFILTSGMVLLFVFYLAFQRHAAGPVIKKPASLQSTAIPYIGPAITTNPSSVAQVTQQSTPAKGKQSSSNSVASAQGTTVQAQTPQPALVQNPRLYKDGEYTGSAADAYYGMVQVKAVIQNGKISDVQFLQYPNDRRNSQIINSQAMPYLTAEAIKAQSANVDVVSGATDTSEAFIQSLSDALIQAKA